MPNLLGLRNWWQSQIVGDGITILIRIFFTYVNPYAYSHWIFLFSTTEDCLQSVDYSNFS